MVPSFARRRSSAQDWSLLSPHDEIETFLAGSVADPKLSFDVALIFARNMAQELRVVLSEWEDVVNVLERVKANVASETNN